MKVYWHYHYVQGQRQILPNDEIDTTPDKFGRWQLKLKVFVDTLALNNSLFDGDDVPIDIAVIEYDSHVDMFKSQAMKIDFRGLNYNYIFNVNVKELMREIESEFSKSVFMLKHLVD